MHLKILWIFVNRDFGLLNLRMAGEYGKNLESSKTVELVAVSAVELCGFGIKVFCLSLTFLLDPKHVLFRLSIKFPLLNLLYQTKKLHKNLSALCPQK